VGPRANLDNVEKRKFFSLPGLELRSLGRPVRRQSLYRLRYPGSYIALLVILINEMNRFSSLVPVWDPLISMFLSMIYVIQLITQLFFYSVKTRSCGILQSDVDCVQYILIIIPLLVMWHAGSILFKLTRFPCSEILVWLLGWEIGPLHGVYLYAKTRRHTSVPQAGKTIYRSTCSNFHSTGIGEHQ
jgi:hypothetical protein